LDVKANCLKNLNGIEKLTNLVKLDASQNAIDNCEGLGEMHKHMEILLLFGNKLSDLKELQRLKGLGSLKEISFAKGGF
jgi:Leucine-rich repeat (LRR) protein